MFVKEALGDIGNQGIEDIGIGLVSCNILVSEQELWESNLSSLGPEKVFIMSEKSCGKF